MLRDGQKLPIHLGLGYSALSGLDGGSFTQYTGLHPVLINYALSGLRAVSTGDSFNKNLGYLEKMIVVK